MSCGMKVHAINSFMDKRKQLLKEDVTEVVEVTAQKEEVVVEKVDVEVAKEDALTLNFD